MVTSRSAVLRDPDGPYSIEEVELDAPRADEVLVRVVAAGMCHTDMLGREPVLAGIRPAILGHEGAGTVEAVGDCVVGLVPGDHVVMSFDSCGYCRQCQNGSPAYCEQFETRNMSGRRTDGSSGAHAPDGTEVTARWFGQSSFGEFALATQRNIVKVDRDIPLAVLGPLGCGIQTGAGAVLNDMRLQPGSSIAVFGVGAVGLSAVMAAKVAGAVEIVAVDIDSARLDLAADLGATRVVDGRVPDIVAQVIGDTGGMDFSFDTTGVGTVMASAVQVLRMRGRCVLVGAGADDFCVPTRALIGREVTFVLEGGAVPQTFIPELIELYRRGVFPMDRLMRRYRLDQINQAEEASRSGAVVKPVLIFGTDEQPEATK